MQLQSIKTTVYFNWDFSVTLPLMLGALELLFYQSLLLKASLLACFDFHSDFPSHIYLLLPSITCPQYLFWNSKTPRKRAMNSIISTPLLAKLDGIRAHLMRKPDLNWHETIKDSVYPT